MYKFITKKCHYCGAVICNLPETEAKDLNHANLLCEDCSSNDFLKEFCFEKVRFISVKPIQCNA